MINVAALGKAGFGWPGCNSTRVSRPGATDGRIGCVPQLIAVRVTYRAQPPAMPRCWIASFGSVSVEMATDYEIS